MSRSLLLAALSLASCGLGTLDQDEFKARYPYGAGPYFSVQGMQEGISALSLGDVQITVLNINPDHIVTTAQDPKSPQSYDTHMFSASLGLTEPTPYQDPPERFAASLFPLRSIEPQKVVAVFNKARAALKNKDVAIETLSISKVDGVIEIDVRWEGSRESGSSVYSMDGTFLR